MSGSQRKTGAAINVLKGRYKVDLRTLHALCEANYARLLRLFPDYESCNSRRFALRSARVQIDVIERSRYTTLFHLQSFRPAASDSQPSLLAPLRIDARAYHDAGMLEVVTFQAEGRIAGRYSYPNRNMHQEDGGGGDVVVRIGKKKKKKKKEKKRPTGWPWLLTGAPSTYV